MKNISIESLYESAGLDRKSTELIIVNFFISFARFEHELVEAKFFKAYKLPNVEVDWDLFNEKCISLQPDQVLSVVNKHWDFLTVEPPRKLNFRQHFFWKRPSAEETRLQNRISENLPSVQDFEDLTILLRRVRNNMFHGSKCRDSNEQTINRMHEVLPILVDLRKLLLTL